MEQQFNIHSLAKELTGIYEKVVEDYRAQT